MVIKMLVVIHPRDNEFHVTIFKGRILKVFAVDLICYSNLCRTIDYYKENGIGIELLETKKVEIKREKSDKKGMIRILNITLIGE